MGHAIKFFGFVEEDEYSGLSFVLVWGDQIKEIKMTGGTGSTLKKVAVGFANLVVGPEEVS